MKCSVVSGFFGGNSMWNFVVFEDEIVVIWGFLSFFNLSDNLFVVMVKGDFDGTSKSVSKWIFELCVDFEQFIVGDSMGWILRWLVNGTHALFPAAGGLN